MKKLFVLSLTLLLIYAIYYDLKVGTLPHTIMEEKEVMAEVSSNEGASSPYFEQKVTPGDTVLSIIESKIDKPIPISISEVIQDFKKLNSGQKPEKIQIGKKYKFPDYSKE
ncbi:MULTISPECIES: hypothetical protein [unclassified Bacillus (in: firmicutes)]|uniref:hypothetical protein n=1 Tax=unclassified Bacillus (in: firmicutes) TaxID=185979 RepID=UPI0008EAD9F5|nr:MULTISPECIES: hypothetical protein [unclassified Bacillus (in: firmicutes)]SFA95989.1 hypothetical protein SAMN02799634_103130 [Bacillus sp. UNCCL13]SFQ79518.1 hypothetical protein SAMN04488577_1763 [Bacillus sp. cl95]